MPPADTGWRVAGRRGRSTADSAAPDPDAANAHDAAPSPFPSARGPPPRGPRPHARVVADAAAAVRALAPAVAAGPAWRRLVARLDEAEADAEEGAAGEGGEGGARWDVKRVTHITVLGLGAVAAPGPPRAQAALACLLAAHVAARRGGGAPPPPITAADPAFSPADADALAALGWRVAAPHTEAVPDVAAVLTADAGACVLAYLPHCDPPVVEGLLAAAWTPAALPRLALVGNSLLALRDKWAGGRCGGGDRPARCLALADAAASGRGGVVEASVAGPAPAGGDPHGAAFNDTAVVVVGAWEAGWGDIV